MLRAVVRPFCCRTGFFAPRTVSPFHSSSKVSDQDSAPEESKPLPRRRRIEVPPEFSKTDSYPTRKSLHEIRLKEMPQPHSNKVVYASRAAVFAIVLFVVYACFFSDYNLEIEENLCRQLPGYRDYMRQNYPDYEERLNKLREKRAAKMAK